uniref:Transmembrane protein 225 domain-containing protein n=1 Tax=Equus caballus TaxID=9796 RepID=F7DVZ5_HORSE
MVHLSTRNVQATNMLFSSWALVFLAVGIIIEEWYLSFSQYSFCFPTDNLKVVRILMIWVLSLSFFHNMFLGLEFTYLLPQTKLVLFVNNQSSSEGTFSPFAWTLGILLLCALLRYRRSLRQGQSVYYASYKITWIIFTAYLNVFFFIQSINCCASLTILHESEREIQDIQQSESSIRGTSLPAHTAMPRSIVCVHSTHTGEDSPNKSQIQTHRVTWAL